MKNTLTTSLLLILCISIVSSCKKDEEEERKANKDLYCDINSGGATYYVGTQVITEGLGGAHGFIKVRYNNIAASALDSTGKLPVGGTFPNGSVVVKEIYSSLSGGLNLYAIMKKETSNENAGSGWLWGEYKPGGEVVFSAAKKGNGCISCHSLPDNRDLNRVFDLH